MTASVESYLSVISRAYEGKVKLPSFQRDWKWSASQVTLLFDSLRQGFPIGGFLFIKSSEGVPLSPRAFHGSSEAANSTPDETLVLDGQQRITAGLELFYGKGGRDYFVDLKKLFELYLEREVDVSYSPSVTKFLADLDGDDGYCVAKKKTADPESLLISKHLLWTATLLDTAEAKRALAKYKSAYPERAEFVDFVVEGNFRPSESTQIPITTIDGHVTIEAISRIFSTLNTTGKLLTPFELVVAVLTPKNIDLADDVRSFREEFPYYRRLDLNGDILLQTIAVIAGKEARKASLPKTITADLYNDLAFDAVEALNQCGQILSEKFGLGLGATSDLLSYPVIFPPMAHIMRKINRASLSHDEQISAEKKLIRWYIGANLSRRYQASTHTKQLQDREEIWEWIQAGDSKTPVWLKETFVRSLRDVAPNGALGRLVLALMNHRGLKDPYSSASVGFKEAAVTTAKHHIFPTKFVRQLEGWSKNYASNLVLNIMFLSEATNSHWYNVDPAKQIEWSEVHTNAVSVREIYSDHLVPEAALEILKKQGKSVEDFHEFIRLREERVFEEFSKYGFVPMTRASSESDELDLLDD